MPQQLIGKAAGDIILPPPPSLHRFPKPATALCFRFPYNPCYYAHSILSPWLLGQPHFSKF